MTPCSVEPRTRCMSKDTDFCLLEETYPTNTEDSYWILLLKHDCCRNQKILQK